MASNEQCVNNEYPEAGADPEILKKGALKVGHHGWPTKKILGFRWSKKAKINWQYISISIFKFSPFLCTIEAYRWNLFNFSKFTNSLIRKEKECSYSSHWEKKSWEKLYFVPELIVLQSLLKRHLIIFSYFACSFAAQYLLFEIRMTQ